MKSLTSNNVLQLVFLELTTITPLLIILGNVIPPFPIKLHHIGLGIIFLLAVATLLMDGYKKWLLYVALIYLLVQFTLDGWYIKGYIDYFFGPFVFVVILDMIVNKRLPEKTMRTYLNRFTYLLWVSPLIAIFQYFNLLPITFWNATYINYAYFGEVAIPRPNGFLYHGSELSIIICLLVIFQFFKPVKKAFWFLCLLTLIAVMTYFKALLGCVLLLFLFYLIFVSKGWTSRIKLFSPGTLLGYFILIAGFVIVAGFLFFMQNYQHTGYFFPRDILTGRGAIWNIYLEKIKEFNWWNYLFGNGMGTSFDIFAEKATPETWYMLAVDPNADTDYDSHNALLSVFINSGLIGLAFIGFIFRMVYRQIRKWLPSQKWNKAVFIGIFILPLLTIGVTIPIYENSIFWIGMGFIIMRWNFEVNDEKSIV